MNKSLKHRIISIVICLAFVFTSISMPSSADSLTALDEDNTQLSGLNEGDGSSSSSGNSGDSGSLTEIDGDSSSRPSNSGSLSELDSESSTGSDPDAGLDTDQSEQDAVMPPPAAFGAQAMNSPMTQNGIGINAPPFTVEGVNWQSFLMSHTNSEDRLELYSGRYAGLFFVTEYNVPEDQLPNPGRFTIKVTVPEGTDLHTPASDMCSYLGTTADGGNLTATLTMKQWSFSGDGTEGSGGSFSPIYVRYPVGITDHEKELPVKVEWFLDGQKITGGEHTYNAVSVTQKFGWENLKPTTTVNRTLTSAASSIALPEVLVEYSLDNMMTKENVQSNFSYTKQVEFKEKFEIHPDVIFDARLFPRMHWDYSTPGDGDAMVDMQNDTEGRLLSFSKASADSNFENNGRISEIEYYPDDESGIDRVKSFVFTYTFENDTLVENSNKEPAEMVSLSDTPLQLRIPDGLYPATDKFTENTNTTVAAITSIEKTATVTPYVKVDSANPNLAAGADNQQILKEEGKIPLSLTYTKGAAQVPPILFPEQTGTIDKEIVEIWEAGYSFTGTPGFVNDSSGYGYYTKTISKDESRKNRTAYAYMDEAVVYKISNFGNRMDLENRPESKLNDYKITDYIDRDTLVPFMVQTTTHLNTYGYGYYYMRIYTATQDADGNEIITTNSEGEEVVEDQMVYESGLINTDYSRCWDLDNLTGNVPGTKENRKRVNPGKITRIVWDYSKNTYSNSENNMRPGMVDRPNYTGHRVFARVKYQYNGEADGGRLEEGEFSNKVDVSYTNTNAEKTTFYGPGEGFDLPFEGEVTSIYVPVQNERDEWGKYAKKLRNSDPDSPHSGLHQGDLLEYTIKFYNPNDDDTVANPAITDKSIGLKPYLEDSKNLLQRYGTAGADTKFISFQVRDHAGELVEDNRGISFEDAFYNESEFSINAQNTLTILLTSCDENGQLRGRLKYGDSITVTYVMEVTACQAGCGHDASSPEHSAISVSQIENEYTAVPRGEIPEALPFTGGRLGPSGGDYGMGRAILSHSVLSTDDSGAAISYLNPLPPGESVTATYTLSNSNLPDRTPVTVTSLQAAPNTQYNNALEWDKSEEGIPLTLTIKKWNAAGTDLVTTTRTVTAYDTTVAYNKGLLTYSYAFYNVFNQYSRYGYVIVLNEENENPIVLHPGESVEVSFPFSYPTEKAIERDASSKYQSMYAGAHLRESTNDYIGVPSNNYKIIPDAVSSIYGSSTVYLEAKINNFYNVEAYSDYTNTHRDDYIRYDDTSRLVLNDFALYDHRDGYGEVLRRQCYLNYKPSGLRGSNRFAVHLFNRSDVEMSIDKVLVRLPEGEEYIGLEGNLVEAHYPSEVGNYKTSGPYTTTDADGKERQVIVVEKEDGTPFVLEPYKGTRAANQGSTRSYVGQQYSNATYPGGVYGYFQGFHVVTQMSKDAAASLVRESTLPDITNKTAEFTKINRSSCDVAFYASEYDSASRTTGTWGVQSNILYPLDAIGAGGDTESFENWAVDQFNSDTAVAAGLKIDTDKALYRAGDSNNIEGRYEVLHPIAQLEITPFYIDSQTGNYEKVDANIPLGPGSNLWWEVTASNIWRYPRTAQTGYSNTRWQELEDWFVLIKLPAGMTYRGDTTHPSIEKAHFAETNTFQLNGETYVWFDPADATFHATTSSHTETLSYYAFFETYSGSTLGLKTAQAYAVPKNMLHKVTKGTQVNSDANPEFNQLRDAMQRVIDDHNTKKPNKKWESIEFYSGTAAKAESTIEISGAYAFNANKSAVLYETTAPDAAIPVIPSTVAERDTSAQTLLFNLDFTNDQDGSDGFPFQDLTLIDRIPTAGDYFTLDSGSRGSTVNLSLIAEPEVYLIKSGETGEGTLLERAKYDLSYTTLSGKGNTASKQHLFDKGDFTGTSETATWTSTLSDISKAAALRVKYKESLKPGETLRVKVKTRADGDTLPGKDAVAANTFAAGFYVAASGQTVEQYPESPKSEIRYKDRTPVVISGSLFYDEDESATWDVTTEQRLTKAVPEAADEKITMILHRKENETATAEEYQRIALRDSDYSFKVYDKGIYYVELAGMSGSFKVTENVPEDPLGSNVANRFYLNESINMIRTAEQYNIPLLDENAFIPATGTDNNTFIRHAAIIDKGLGSLTITKTLPIGHSIVVGDNIQKFLFRIDYYADETNFANRGNPDLVFYEVIEGKGDRVITGLPDGFYEVTEVDWATMYEQDGAVVYENGNQEIGRSEKELAATVTNKFSRSPILHSIDDVVNRFQKLFYS